jgi:hypothetical protein
MRKLNATAYRLIITIVRHANNHHPLPAKSIAFFNTGRMQAHNLGTTVVTLHILCHARLQVKVNKNDDNSHDASVQQLLWERLTPITSEATPLYRVYTQRKKEAYKLLVIS